MKTKTIKEKQITLKEAKLEALRLGLEVNKKYDKRYLGTWLHTIGIEGAIPRERQLIKHVPTKKKALSLADLIQLSKKQTS